MNKVVIGGVAALAIVALVGALVAHRLAVAVPQEGLRSVVEEVAKVEAGGGKAAFAAHVEGAIHSRGGELGTWDVALGDCRSGEVNGFSGVDFFAAGSDRLRLRYVHDEAVGAVIKVAYPSRPGTVNVFHRGDCAVLEDSLSKTHVSTAAWNGRGRIRHLEGHVKFDCAHEDEPGRVAGEVNFTNCH